MKTKTIRTSHKTTEEVECLGEYREHFLFINYKGNLAIGHEPTGLMLREWNRVVQETGMPTRENWKSIVDELWRLIEQGDVLNDPKPFKALGTPIDHTPQGLLPLVLKSWRFSQDELKRTHKI